MYYYSTLISLIEVVLVLVPMLVGIAYITIAERKTLPSVQRIFGFRWLVFELFFVLNLAMYYYPAIISLIEVVVVLVPALVAIFPFFFISMRVIILFKSLNIPLK